ncbi:MAG: hypothetical protein ACLTDS_02400 [Bianqueaceae bacterium]
MKMHAGEVSNGSGRRAHGDIFPAGTVETTMTAGNRDKKCTPVRRATAATSGHTETNFPAGTVETTMPAGILNEKCTPTGSLPIYVGGQDYPFPDSPFAFIWTSSTAPAP